MATAWRMGVSVRTVMAIAGRALKLALSPDGEDERSDQYDLPALETAARERRWLDAHGV